MSIFGKDDKAIAKFSETLLEASKGRYAPKFLRNFLAEIYSQISRKISINSDLGQNDNAPSQLS